MIRWTVSRSNRLQFIISDCLKIKTAFVIVWGHMKYTATDVNLYCQNNFTVVCDLIYRVCEFSASSFSTYEVRRSYASLWRTKRRKPVTTLFYWTFQVSQQSQYRYVTTKTVLHDKSSKTSQNNNCIHSFVYFSYTYIFTTVSRYYFHSSNNIRRPLKFSQIYHFISDKGINCDHILLWYTINCLWWADGDI